MITVIFSTGVAAHFSQAIVKKMHDDGSTSLYSDNDMSNQDWIATIPAATNCIICNSHCDISVFEPIKDGPLPVKEDNVRTCRKCGCTDDDCRQCIKKTGKPCVWVEEDLCSACVEPQKRNSGSTRKKKQPV